VFGRRLAEKVLGFGFSPPSSSHHWSVDDFDRGGIGFDEDGLYHAVARSSLWRDAAMADGHLGLFAGLLRLLAGGAVSNSRWIFETSPALSLLSAMYRLARETASATHGSRPWGREFPDEGQISGPAFWWGDDFRVIAMGLQTN